MAGRKNFDPRLALKPGNVSGTQRRHVKEYAKVYAEEMIDLLYDIANNEENYARDRIQAIESILNRAYGKPADAKHIDDERNINTIDVQRLTTPELMQMFAQAQILENQTKLLGVQVEAATDDN